MGEAIGMMSTHPKFIVCKLTIEAGNGSADLNMVFRFHRNSASSRSPRQVPGGHEMPLDYQAVDVVVGRDPRNILTIVYLSPDGLLYDIPQTAPEGAWGQRGYL